MTTTNFTSAIVQGDQIANIYNPNGDIPFPFEKLFPEGINLYEKHLNPEIFGAIRREDDGTYSIVVNSSLPEEQKYFTAAHEVAHCYLHKKEIDDSDNSVYVDNGGGWALLDNPTIRTGLSQRNREIEEQADDFAAAILIPTEKACRAWEITNHSVSKCARIFNVPERIMDRWLIKIACKRA